MPIRNRLQALVTELRHARTRLFPLELAERVQHTIVRAEQLLMAQAIPPADAEALLANANRLLQECAAIEP